VIAPGRQRLEDLFVRYWDDALSPQEAGELADRLAADPVARFRFRFLCFQAVAAADRPAAGLRRWSRRAWLRSAGVGVAAGLAAGAICWNVFSDKLPAGARLVSSRGRVRVTAAGESAGAAGTVVPTGGVVSTHGSDSSALLAFPDGSSVSLTGDSSAAVANDGRRLLLHHGNVAADVRPCDSGGQGEPPPTGVDRRGGARARPGGAIDRSRGPNRTGRGGRPNGFGPGRRVGRGTAHRRV